MTFETFACILSSNIGNQCVRRVALSAIVRDLPVGARQGGGYCEWTYKGRRKAYASNAGRKPERYTGNLIVWRKPLVRNRGGRICAKPGGTAEVIITLLSQ